jgi:GMP synthase (glutamine-hydrolysing)
MDYICTTPRLRIAIIGCGSVDQEPMTYREVKYTIRELLGKKIRDFAKEKGFRVEPQIYWPAGRHDDYPAPGTYDAVIIPGSKLNIDQKGIEDNPWMEGLIDFIRHIDRPLLGICFGHQAIAVAHGGKLKRIPEPFRVEVGFSPVNMTNDGISDELFRAFPRKFDGLFSHYNYVSKTPEKGKVLATGFLPEMVQAYRIGKFTWGVQFHPDYSGENIGELVVSRKGTLAKMLDISTIKTINPERKDHKVLENFLEVTLKTGG